MFPFKIFKQLISLSKLKNMSTVINNLEADHKGIIVKNKYKLMLKKTQHDTQYDYYGTRLATAGSDGKINIFDISNKSLKKLAELTK